MLINFIKTNEYYKNKIIFYYISINIKYIKTPNVVKFDLDLNKCVNCDLPAYTHFDIVERAVLKFKASIGASIESNPQRRQTS